MAWSAKARAASATARKKSNIWKRRKRPYKGHLDANIREAKAYPKVVLEKHNLRRAVKKRMGKDMAKQKKRKRS